MLSTIPLAHRSFKTDYCFTVKKEKKKDKFSNVLPSVLYNDGIQSQKLPGLHRERACPKTVHFMTP